MSTIVLYHGCCADGFAAACAVAYSIDPELNFEYKSQTYGGEIPDVKGKDVIVVDFSYPRDTLIAMHKDAKSLIVLDHHKSSKEALEGLDFCIFDMNRSGAMMAWDYYNPNTTAPLMIQYVQDRDLWTWALPDSKAISAALRDMRFDMKEWLTLFDDNYLMGCVAKGEGILAVFETQIKACAKRKHEMIEVCGYTVPCFNTTIHASEICNELVHDYPFVMAYFDSDNERVYSLRSDGGVDVSIIAGTFGGGGHPMASGFSTAKPEHLFNKVL